MTHYSVEPRNCILVKEHGSLSFAKIMGKNICKSVSRNLISKYSEKLDHAKQSADASQK